MRVRLKLIQLSISITFSITVLTDGVNDPEDPFYTIYLPITQQFFSSVSPEHPGQMASGSICNYLMIDCCLT